MLDALPQRAATGDAAPQRTFAFEVVADAASAAVEVVSNGIARGRGPDRRASPTAASTSRSSAPAPCAPTGPSCSRSGRSASGVLDWTDLAAAGRHAVRAADVRRRRRRRDHPAPAAAVTVDTAEYASRRIVGIVFVVLSFLTLVFYGLWVASGVVAEKANRVMELLISAATAPQLVIGKIGGIGLAGLTQVSLVLAPAIVVLLRLGTHRQRALLGPDETAAAVARRACRPACCSRSSCTSRSGSRSTRRSTPARAR